MSLWEFQAAVAGWMRANVPDDGKDDHADTDALWSMMQERGYVH